MSKNKQERVFRCKRCQNIVRSSSKNLVDDIYHEDKCPDPEAPGGYWYCDYEELVPKPKKKGKQQ